MRSLCLLTLSLCVSLFAACGDKKKGEQEAQAASCESNSDCAQGEVCLAKECAKASPGAIYTDPENAVTPEKVKDHMDMINKAAEERVDAILKEAE